MTRDFSEAIAELLANCEARAAAGVEEAPAPIITPPPIVRTVNVPLSLAEQMLHLWETDRLTWARQASSYEASLAIARNYSLDVEDVRAVMAQVPVNLWHLLDSPEGWSVMGEQIAVVVKGWAPGRPLIPTKH